MGLSKRPETFEDEKSTYSTLVNLHLDSLALVAGQQNPVSLAWYGSGLGYSRVKLPLIMLRILNSVLSPKPPQTEHREHGDGEAWFGGQ